MINPVFVTARVHAGLSPHYIDPDEPMDDAVRQSLEEGLIEYIANEPGWANSWYGVPFEWTKPELEG